ncbi:MAG: hypothetical protein J0L73_16705 [Verrucomicrobia bacterium]|nr:hypothetical protein [Verrucomicrobiota bacterium]
MESNPLPTIGRIQFSVARAVILLLAAYSATLWLLMERATDWGALLESYRHEYAGGGSMAFRTFDGRCFVSLAIPWGLFVYPSALIAALSFLAAASHSSSTRQRICRLSLCAAMFAILMRFFFLGVASCSLGSL